MKQRFVVLDLETTGNSPKKKDKIIQVGAVLIEDGEIVERFASFVNPECTIPPFIEQLTSINNEMVQKAPTFSQIAPMLLEMLEASDLVAHNVPFDLSFLQHELQACGLPAFSGNTIDTVELARILLPTQKSYKLMDLSNFYGLDHENPHRADSDAEATAKIFLKLVEKIKRLPHQTSVQLHQLLHNMKSDISILFDMFETEPLREHMLYQNRLVLKNLTKHPNEKTNIIKEKVKEKLLGLNITGEAFLEVQTLLEARQHGLLEMPYRDDTNEHFILAALQFALEHNKKVVISNHHSIFNSYLTPILEKLALHGDDASLLFSTIKGKYYYLSLPRFLQALEEKDDNYDAVLTKAQILVWLNETETGDMEELSLSSGGRLLWNSLNCASTTTINDKHDFCFYLKAFERLQDANLILTNHTFLAKEIWKQDVFKDIGSFIVDDADRFHHNVSRFLGKEISYLDIHFALSKLGDYKTVQHAREELDDTFRIIRSYCLTRSKNAQFKATYRYDLLKEKNAAWFAVQEAAQRLFMKLTDVIQMIEKDLNGLVCKSTTTSREMDFKLVAEKLHNMRDTFYSLLFEPNKERLTWFEVNIRGARNSVSIFEQPLDISHSLADKFYQRKSSVIFISPALSVNNNYDYMMEELGLLDFYPKTATLIPPAVSSFPCLYIPTDIPLISKGKNESFIQTASLQIRELLNQKGGRILVTFSSLEMLSAVYQQLKDFPNSEETMIVSQSSVSGGKQKILKTAAAFEQAILLVTNSFLEEVSIKNEAIDSLVVIRLPFKAMDEPVMTAKLNLVEKQGRNSFTDISLPIAVLRFRKMIAAFLEGPGSKDIFILDRRVIDKRYGETFINAVPNSIVKKASFFSILSSIN